MFFYDVIVQVCNRSLGHNRTAVREVESVTHAQTEIERLFDEQDADVPFFFNFQKRVTDEVNDVWLDAFGGFVEDQNFGVSEQRAGDRQLLLLAAAFKHPAFALEKFA